ncbi:hypothetical protein [Rhodovulum sp.]|uniref:hypothetical protein n=1 Tax=Rhodovulum sp. TaxID=34009 RepID=UPI00257ABDAB|nr:hypothetical protein [Rhodovulum sp.]
MFPGLPGLHVDDDKLMALAEAMMDDGGQSDHNKAIPTGFTYLRQFVDHDITLDLTSLGDKMRDPTAVRNFRSPALDLDSVYGRGQMAVRIFMPATPPPDNRRRSCCSGATSPSASAMSRASSATTCRAAPRGRH